MKRWTTTCAFFALAIASSLAQTTIRFTAIHALPSNQVELMWSSDTNRWYAIEQTPDPMNWNNEFDFVIPDDSTPSESNHWTPVTDTNPCFFRICASSPVGSQDNVYTNIGTISNDTQIVFGTTFMDYILQFGDGSNDTQYASADADDDWIVQYGGMGSDTQGAYGGSADDWIYQDGGVGDDTLTASAGSGDDWLIQFGDDGDDDIGATTADGADTATVHGGLGDDMMHVDGGDDDDTIHMCGADGNDQMTYDVSFGADTVVANGGSGSDILKVNYTTHSFAIRLPDGAGLYTIGLPDTVITVLSLETIYIVDGDGATNWTGSAP